ncbi:MAG TPA: AAA family ATPase [Phycisphaerae bacterium]|nr:AAA family ATPase [Phycisphaerae bacterium]HUU93375.1 AAA family ATPase [Phycisphaerae bacterium]
MKIQLRHLVLRTRETIEQIAFSEVVTFLHGPVGTGKSTVARLVDYCLGGDLERTPAIQAEFVAVELALILGDYECSIERAAGDTQRVRITWSGPGGDIGSVNAPLTPQAEPLLDAEVYNLSDLVFHLCGVAPIKIRQRSRDANSPLIRLSFRDIWRYCYLDQANLDSSFFRFEDPFRGRKSQDAMRFFTGLHSERLSQLEAELMSTIDEQRAKRGAVQQIRTFMTRFELGSELDIVGQLQAAEGQLAEAERRRSELERARSAQTHPTDALRDELRRLSAEIEDLRRAIAESEESIGEQKALRAEFITAKTKAERVDQAGQVLEGICYERCPECGSDLSDRPQEDERCHLCGSALADETNARPLELEALRRDLNERIDQIADSIERRERESSRMVRRLGQQQQEKAALDRQLQEELARYDSPFVESIRVAEREIATLVERISSVRRLQQMPQAISALEEEAGALQGPIDRLRTSVSEERARLRAGDANIAAIAAELKRVMLSVSFPGVSEEDEVVIDPRNWKPTVVHGDQEWTFWDTGSGGKKTLFNVCYALAIHSVAMERGMPVPGLLIIDSPTKNISEDEDPELVRSLYAEIYRLARGQDGSKLQFLLIDSNLVPPGADLPGFSERRMAGEPNAPSLIPYYEGP